MKTIKHAVLTVVLYVAVGYFVGIPISVIGDGMFRAEKPMPKTAAVLGWPLLTVVVVIAFPPWLHEHYRNRRYGKNS